MWHFLLTALASFLQLYIHEIMDCRESLPETCPSTLVVLIPNMIWQDTHTKDIPIDTL